MGQVRPGFIADLLIVDGDPTQDVSILQNKANIVGILQGGVFYKRPVDAMAEAA